MRLVALVVRRRPRHAEQLRYVKPLAMEGNNAERSKHTTSTDEYARVQYFQALKVDQSVAVPYSSTAYVLEASVGEFHFVPTIVRAASWLTTSSRSGTINSVVG